MAAGERNESDAEHVMSAFFFFHGATVTMVKPYKRGVFEPLPFAPIDLEILTDFVKKKRVVTAIGRETNYSMEFSSSSSSGRIRTEKGVGSEAWNPLLCYCGVEVSIVTSWSGENPGRRFYGCGIYKFHGRRMYKFFEWYDQQNPRDKKIIVGLLKKLEEMKKKDRLLVISLVMCILVIILMVILYVTK